MQERIEPRKPVNTALDEGQQTTLVNIAGLSRDNLEAVMQREFGVTLDKDLSDEDAMAKARHMIDGRNKFQAW